MKNLLPIALDTAFIFAASLVAALAVTRFYLDGIWVCLIISLSVAIAAASLFRYVSHKKSVRFSLKREDEEKKQSIMNSLSLMSTEELNCYFCSLLDKMNVPYVINGGSQIALTDGKAVLFYYFSFSKTYAGRVIEFYKQTEKSLKTLVIGREFDEETQKLTSRFRGRITLLDGTALYLLMKRFEHFPPIKDEVIPPKKERFPLKTVFNKTKAKKYFLYGLALEFFSFFTFYPTYYIVFGTALILLSIICYFFGIQEVKESQNPFK